MPRSPMLSMGLAAMLAAAFALPAAAQSTAPAPAQPEADAPAPDADTAVMTVNGVAITLGELIAVRQTLPAELQEYPDEFLMKALTEQLRDQQLLAEAALARGLKDSRTVHLALHNQERAVLADAFMADEMLARMSPEEIERIYQERYVAAEPIEEVRAAHIVVETEEEALALKAELEAGADFSALAGEYSLDQAANHGGDLGWFARDEMAPAFAEAAFDLAEGAISPPVQSPYGWHLIKLDGRRTRAVPGLAEVQSEIIGELSQTVQNAILAELRAAAEIRLAETPVPAAALRQDELIVD